MQRDENKLSPDEAKVMSEITDKIINEVGRGRMEVDMVNACLLVIQLICDESQSLQFGEVAADRAFRLGFHILKHSVMRQTAAARLELIGPAEEPGGLNEPVPEDPAFPEGPARAKKPYLN